MWARQVAWIASVSSAWTGAARRAARRSVGMPIERRRRADISSRREQRGHRRLPRPAAHFDLAAGEADVDLAANAEAPRQVDARLDGEAGVAQVAAHVVRLEVVVVHAVAVGAPAEVVAGAAQEAVAAAGAHDDA